MAHRINEDCINCGACVPECPVEAITEGEDIYVVNETTCVDCQGHYDEPQCVAVCPVDCIIHV